MVLLLAVAAGQDLSHAQLLRRNRNRVQPPSDSAVVTLPDSVLARRDSIHRADSVARSDSLNMLSKSSLDRPAFSTAKDSIITDFSGGKRKVFYYGGATVTYQDMKLTADYIEYDMEDNTVFARGRKDVTTGEWVGQPEMTQGDATYKMEELRYNFNSRKARITNMITQESEGLLQGQKIKMMPDQSINMQKGMYTVCDLEHPHYYLKMTMAKVVTQPSQKTVFGPAFPVIADVPIPIGLPFGFVPQKPTRATGLLMPTFGEEVKRGFFMRDAGMYFVIGDYFDLSITGDYYTLGSYAIDINSRYKVNYKFNGNFSLNYSNDQTGEKGSKDFNQSKNFGVRWSHTQDSKAHPGTTFSASVNFSSPSNSKYNARSVNEALQNQISSSISYSHNWNGKFNLSVNALHSQNSRDSSYSFTLPNITFSVTRFYPFKQKNRVGKEKAYEKISFGYSTSLQNKINFKLRDMQDFVLNPDGSYAVNPETGYRIKELGDSLGIKALERLTNGMGHNFQIGLPNFTLLKYLNFTPSVNYGMNWFFRKSEAYFDPETNSVKTEMGRQFGTFGTTHNYSGSMQMSTRIYGMFNFGRGSKIQAIRHVMSPNIGISISPEKGKAFNGWRTLNYVDTLGVARTYDYNIYAGQVNSAPGKGRSATMTFSLTNNLEAKVRSASDTTGNGSKKVKILDQLNLSTGYNFLADSLRMNPVGVTMSTSVFGKVGINGNLNFDPYAIDGQGRRINKYNLMQTGVPLRLTNASASLSYSLSGKGQLKGNDGSMTVAGGETGGNPADYYRRIYYHPVTGQYIPGGWLYYTNPDVPWSVNFNYSFQFNRSYRFTNNQLVRNDRFTQTLGVSGNVQLTPKMSLQAQTGWDFMMMKMTTTQLSAKYDLHCFNIQVSWIPTGMYQSYSFLICANASALADLLRFKKSSSYWDN